MSALVRPNEAKIVGDNTYTSREIELLASARSNTLKTLR